MKPKFLSLSGVRTLVQWIKDMLSEKVDKEDGKTLSDNNYSDSDVAKLAGIESGSQENVIESISVNGTAQTVTNKNVEIAVPLVDATLSQSGQAADAEQVGEVMQEFTDAFVRVGTQINEVRESVPTATSQLTNDSEFVTATQLNDELATKQDAMDYGTVTAEDVGKAMRPKTVANGKVTSWEFGEAGKVDDVQVNGRSILENKVANIPIATDSTLGTVKVKSANGIQRSLDGTLILNAASSSVIKSGTDTYRPIVPDRQHDSTFYGLAKAAGDSTQSSSSNPVGQYTNEAKQSILTMLGVNDAIAEAVGDITGFDYEVVQELPATGEKGIIYLVAHSHGANDVYDEYIWVNNGYEKIGNTDIDLSNYVAFDDYATNLKAGVVKVANTYGIRMENGVLRVDEAASSTVKQGTDPDHPIVAKNQHESAFYGLAKAAGDITQSQSSNAVGTYTDEAKFAIQTMLGVPSIDDIPENVVIIEGEWVESDGTNPPYVNYTDITMTDNKLITMIDESIAAHENKTFILSLSSSSQFSQETTMSYKKLYYLQSQIDISQIVHSYIFFCSVANMDDVDSFGHYIAVSKSTIGDSTVWGDYEYSINRKLNAPTTAGTAGQVLTSDGNGGQSWQDPTGTVTDVQVNGATVLSNGIASVTVPTNNNQLTNGAGYQTENDVKAVVADSFQDGIEINVTGTTPTITANANTRYICGEVTSLTVTPPENGVTEVIFTAGTTVPTLTLPATVKMPEWFTIESGYTYAINIENATYGTVMMWQT